MTNSELSPNAEILTKDEKTLIDVFRKLHIIDQYRVVVYAGHLAGELSGECPPSVQRYLQTEEPSIRVILREKEIDGYKYSLCIYATKE